MWKNIFKKSENIIKEIEAIKPEIEAVKNNENHILHIGVGHAPNISVLSHLIHKYCEQTDIKNIHFDICESLSYQTQQDLLNRKIDIGFNQYMGSSSLNASYMYSEELYLYVSNNHYLAKKDNVELSEIIDLPMVTFGENSGTAKVITDIYASVGKIPNIINRCSSDYLLLETIASGIGVSITAHLPEILFYPVKSLKLDNGKWKRHYYMLWRKDFKPEPIVNDFIDFVKKCYRI